METYILEDDEVGRRFAAALVAKQHEGVQVNLIRDSVGTLNTPKEFFKKLADGGINMLEFNPVNPLTAKSGWDVNQRDHRKLLIVDGRTAFLGGINFSSVYSGGSFSEGSKGRTDDKLPWRDTDLQIDGPVVAELQKLFIETWEKQKGPPLPKRQYFPRLTRQGDEVVHAIAGSPDEPYSLIYATLISAIDAAETEVLLTNAYFVPDPQLAEGRGRARRRCEDRAAGGHRFGAGVPRRPLVLRRAAARRHQALRAPERGAAREDGADRRRVGHGGLDQPRLAQLPAQPGSQRGRAGQELRPAHARRVRR
jgi:cardiolipin synthase